MQRSKNVFPFAGNKLIQTSTGAQEMHLVYKDFKSTALGMLKKLKKIILKSTRKPGEQCIIK